MQLGDEVRVRARDADSVFGYLDNHIDRLNMTSVTYAVVELDYDDVDLLPIGIGVDDFTVWCFESELLLVNSSINQLQDVVGI